MRAKSMQKLTDELYAHYPGMTIWGKGDPAHALRVSDHNEDDTAGVRAAQSDADNTPEHRAVDASLSAGFTRTEALKVIQDIITRERAKPKAQRKLRYINFETTQWHTRDDYAPMPNADDPHPTHVHFSGEATQDDNTTQWLSTTATGGLDMFCKQDDPIGSGKAAVLQAELNVVLEYIGDAERLVVDDDYGKKTASALLRTGCGNAANNGSVYWVGEYITLQDKLRDIAAAKAVRAHLDAANHGGADLPESITFTVPAQQITAPLTEE